MRNFIAGLVLVPLGVLLIALAVVNRKPVTLGLRPEHITEPRQNGRGDGSDFAVTLDVVEPLGMETMVFFTLNGTEVCGRVEPSSAADAGATMQLHANVDHMHLIDPASGAVI